jgi:Tfp pilus assembly protein PilV
MHVKKHFNPELRSKNCQGFILLEVLVAMTMILGVWMASVGVYQHLALSLTQQESKRSQLRKDSDAFEIQEHSRAHLNLPNQALSNESARMSSRTRSMHTSTQPTTKDKR